MLNESSLSPITSSVKFTGSQLSNSAGASALVIFTSLLTETIHPVLTYTRQTTISNDPVTEFVTSQLITATNFETVQSVTVTFSSLPGSNLPESSQSETQQGTTLQTPSPTSRLSSVPSWTSDTTISTSPDSQLPSLSSLAGSVDPITHTSEGHPLRLVSASSTSIFTSPLGAGTTMTTHSAWPISVSQSDPGLQRVTSSLEGTSNQASSTFSTQSWVTTTTSLPAVAVQSDSSSDDAYRKASHLVGTIVGSVVGGMAFILLALLACLLFYRRRRRNSLHRRLHSRVALLRSDSDNSARAFLDGHNRQPSWPIDHASATTPSEPFPPAARHHTDRGKGTNHGYSTANQKLAVDGNVWDGYHQYSIGGPWTGSKTKPKIEISPPSRSASIYSRQSWEDRLESLEFYNNGEFTSPSGYSPRHHSGGVDANRDRAVESSTVRNPPISSQLGMTTTDTYYPNSGSTTTLPEAGYETPNSNNLATPKRRASIRSNPFDLEFPASAASKSSEFDPQLSLLGNSGSCEYPEPVHQHPLPRPEFPNSPWSGRC